MKHDKKRSFAVASLFALGLLALAQGCGDDKNDAPDPIIPVDEGGSGGKGTTGGKNSGGSGGKNSDGGTGAVNEGGTGAVNEGGTGATGDGGDGPIEPPACTLPELGEDGCFNCPKDNETEQFLNRCVDGSKCVAFDNGRVKLLNADGSLPPFDP